MWDLISKGRFLERQSLNGLWMTSEWPLNDLWMTSEWPLNYLWMTSEWPLNDHWTTSEQPQNDLWTTSEWPLNDLWIPSLNISHYLGSKFSYCTQHWLYSQTCGQLPPLGLKKTGHCSKVVVIQRFVLNKAGATFDNSFFDNSFWLSLSRFSFSSTLN